MNDNGEIMKKYPYDPELPDSEYEIYTDEDSIAQMHSRWRRLAMALGGIFLVAALVTIVNREGPNPGQAWRRRSVWLWLVLMILCHVIGLYIHG
ncbi:MAG: hypothetical protein HFI88_14140 [Lachnospiraceae bacterium]|nr:hypothetical protein [Lachnospiraceae bacterium]